MTSWFVMSDDYAKYGPTYSRFKKSTEGNYSLKQLNNPPSQIARSIIEIMGLTYSKLDDREVIDDLRTVDLKETLKMVKAHYGLKTRSWWRRWRRS